MRVIPVLDLLDGHVVRAVRGDRANYRPIQSSLCATSEPLAVARALLDASGADTLYVADLGAIVAQHADTSTLAALYAGLNPPGSATQPRVTIWLDAGFADFTSMHAHLLRIGAPRGAFVPVFGSETLRTPDALRDAERAGYQPILSLDRRAGRPLHAPGAAATVHDTPAWWPARVIAMTLDRVGAYEGPDLDTFNALRERAGSQRTVIGAGGVRNRADLDAAAQRGAQAWLVGSALHDGKLAAPPHAVR
ncbi:HisA/HisF-related TIM barrel protein [Paraburkholderia rhizosphaerae]|uniref:Phosphoribosylformimino-5-aminoimidazole carboxamide ribotide isomerase n=1 Tax=Paraburkholderia rhizosphaerae TaxID=480658 RepID=A0A4R8LZI4_9BURK|nr:HisA/HisF-related TIM barrel protein [Paraburkholderia rhizosphaerae]TDY52150.1 phosphoribosylformimino-5-aminoimidazole carboxamide ribotide isomerase [Paraburkholderia rhizosphaerae]